MGILTREKIRYFKDFDEDLVKTSDQNYQISPEFKWIRKDNTFKFWSNIISNLAKVFAWGYSKIYLKQSFVNLDILKAYRDQGFFLYANHTQPVGDPFLPMLVGNARKYYAICVQANLGVPIVGPLMPYGGALPIPSDLHQLPKLVEAVKYHINQGDYIAIYPEAHVWPYYTKIRPFSEAAFHFPVITDAPSFVMTNTYQKAKYSKRPKIITYLDGPFFPDKSLPKKQRQRALMDQIHQVMEKRSLLSDVEYVKYIRKDG